MALDLYCVPGGAPSRNVILTAKAVGVDLKIIPLNLMEGEQLKPEFIKINPQHVVPTLVDNGFSIWESRAIMTYLVEQYAKDDSLYPKDIKKKAIVNQRMYFDMGTMYGRFADYYYPIMFGAGSPDPAKMEKIHEAFSFLDQFIGNNDYTAGDTLTLADLCLVSTVSTFEVMGYDFSSRKNVARWYEKIKATLPYYEEANGKLVLEFKELVDSLKKK